MTSRRPRTTLFFVLSSLLAGAVIALGAAGCDGGQASTGGGGAAPGGAGGAGAGGATGGGGAEVLPTACDPEPTDVVPTPTAKLLEPAGDTGSVEGIFDPSLVYPGGAPAGAMSYSSVASAEDIHTRIAVSADEGATWTVIADANQSVPLTLPSTNAAECPGGSCTGMLVHEVSSLAFDPEDPDPARAWKLFVHSYLVLPGGKLLYDHGHIAMQTAPAPEGPWSEGAAAIGWSSPTPFSSDGAALLVGDVPELSDCLLMTEPGALVVPGRGLDLALGCASFGGEVEIRIVLLRSVDHGATFQYVSDLLTAEDAACLGGTQPQINAASLFLAGGQEYLFATPAGDLGYRGCHLFRVEDPDAGTLLRDTAGQPIALRRIDVDTKGFVGACAFAEGAKTAGVLVPWATLEAGKRTFRILAPGIAVP